MKDKELKKLAERLKKLGKSDSNESEVDLWDALVSLTPEERLELQQYQEKDLPPCGMKNCMSKASYKITNLYHDDSKLLCARHFQAFCVSRVESMIVLEGERGIPFTSHLQKKKEERGWDM